MPTLFRTGVKIAGTEVSTITVSNCIWQSTGTAVRFNNSYWLVDLKQKKRKIKPRINFLPTLGRAQNGQFTTPLRCARLCFKFKYYR